jgi:hypothetical protein
LPSGRSTSQQADSKDARDCEEKETALHATLHALSFCLL